LPNFEPLPPCSLSVTSRLFYERTKVKQAVSITCAGFGLMLLGFCSYSAGESQSAKDQAGDVPSAINDDNLKASYEALASGYGFASFCYIVASILLFSAAIYISPSCCGYLISQYVLFIRHCMIDLVFLIQICT
jgi:hypothetical protein